MHLRRITVHGLLFLICIYFFASDNHSALAYENLLPIYQQGYPNQYVRISSQFLKRLVRKDIVMPVTLSGTYQNKTPYFASGLMTGEAAAQPTNNEQGLSLLVHMAGKVHSTITATHNKTTMYFPQTAHIHAQQKVDLQLEGKPEINPPQVGVQVATGWPKFKVDRRFRIMQRFTEALVSTQVDLASMNDMAKSRIAEHVTANLAAETQKAIADFDLSPLSKDLLSSITQSAGISQTKAVFSTEKEIVLGSIYTKTDALSGQATQRTELPEELRDADLIFELHESMPSNMDSLAAGNMVGETDFHYHVESYGGLKFIAKEAKNNEPQGNAFITFAGTSTFVVGFNDGLIELAVNVTSLMTRSGKSIQANNPMTIRAFYRPEIVSQDEIKVTREGGIEVANCPDADIALAEETGGYFFPEGASYSLKSTLGSVKSDFAKDLWLKQVVIKNGWLSLAMEKK